MKDGWQAPAVGMLHWDSKQLSMLDGGGVEERLPVLLSGAGGTKFLGAPALPPLDGRPVGDLIADAALGCADQWNCKDCIIGMVFDTTSSNTGMNTLL